MKKPLRTLAAIAGALVLLVIIALVAVAFSIDALARRAVESGGSRALGVPTSLNSADVGLFAGTFDLAGLRVENPPGYSSPHFLTLAKGGVAVSAATLAEPTVELPRLHLDRLDAHLEKRGGKANYQVIADNLKKLGGPSQPSEPSSDGKRFVIHELAITNVVIHVDLIEAPGPLAQTVGAATRVNIPIDEIRLKNVGRTGTGVGGTGVTLKELAGIVVRAVLAAADKGAGLLPPDLLADLSSSIADIKSLPDAGMAVIGDAKATVENLGKEAGKAAEDLRKTAEDLGKGLRDALPKKP